MVHIIELSSAIHGYHDDEVPPNVLVNLSSRSRTSSIRHAVLILKARNPVHWHISIQRLHCSLDVIVSTYIPNCLTSVIVIEMIAMTIVIMMNLIWMQAAPDSLNDLKTIYAWFGLLG